MVHNYLLICLKYFSKTQSVKNKTIILCTKGTKKFTLKLRRNTLQRYLQLAKEVGLSELSTSGPHPPPGLSPITVHIRSS